MTDKQLKFKCNISLDKTYVVYLKDCVKLYTVNPDNRYFEIELGDYYEDSIEINTLEEYQVAIISTLLLNPHEAYVYNSIQKAHEAVEARLFDFCD